MRRTCTPTLRWRRFYDFDEAFLTKVKGYNAVMGALLTDAYLKHKIKKDNDKQMVEMDNVYDEAITTSVKKLKGKYHHGHYIDNHTGEPSCFFDDLKGHDYVYSRCGQEKLHYSPTGVLRYNPHIPG